ncbi:hypothetical protein OUZ56_016673 [Daphnia magna]|uniref:Uncharacterized protein n=1 Tax=Daphnia magna TaxID=35525 RepID=A0ABR0ARA4_9CRUS|nr:hypothetical protein OUZ56_016673 [Daphnia magna]
MKRRIGQRSVSYLDAQSDYTTREESQVQKTMQGVTYDSYGKESYSEVLGNTNMGSSYWVSPEGQNEGQNKRSRRPKGSDAGRKGQVLRV